MYFLRNIFSSLISFFLVPLCIIFIIANSFFGVFLNAENFKSVLKKNDTYNRLAQDVIPTLLVNIATNVDSEAAIPPKALGDIIAKVDKKALATDLEKVVNSTYDFVTSDTKHFETRIDLTQYTTPIAANLKQSLADYYNNLPTCTPVEEAEITQNFSNTLKCRLNGLDVTKYLEALKIDDLVAEMKTGFPTELIINEKKVSTYPETALFEDKTVNKDQENFKGSVLLNLQKTIQSYRIGTSRLVITILVLFILLALTRIPNLGSICKWLSSALFAASILPFSGSTLLLYFLKPDFFKSALNSLIGKDFGSDFQTALVALVSDNLSAFSNKVFQQMQLLSLISIVIAIVLYALYFFLERRSNQKSKKTLDEVLQTTHNIGN